MFTTSKPKTHPKYHRNVVDTSSTSSRDVVGLAKQCGFKVKPITRQPLEADDGVAPRAVEACARELVVAQANLKVSTRRDQAALESLHIKFSISLT